MGRSGPPPMDPSQRKRRNATLPMTELPRASSAAAAPELPGRSKYLAQTRAWYRTWCESGQATQFSPTDWQRLHMLAPIVDQYHRLLQTNQVDKAVKLLSQIERSEARFGATADDRQRLRWKLAALDDSGATPIRQAQTSRRRADPRVLEAIE